MIERLELRVVGLGFFGLRHPFIAEYRSDAIAGSAETDLPVAVEC